jgi:hypothetical protein
MSTIAATITPLASADERNGWLVTWSGLQNGDVGAPLELFGHADRSVQVEGTFGAGGKCQLKGSNDAAHYRTLHTPQGNALEFTAADIAELTEITAFTRPEIVSGDGTTALTVTMVVRRTNK